MGLDLSGTKSELDKSISVQTTDPEDVEQPSVDDTRWQSQFWTTYNGYYTSHNSVKATINKVALWGVGNGIVGEEKTLDKWRGWGKESAEDIISNLMRTRRTNGDAYAEIIRDKGITKLFGLIKSKPINLKIMNPGKMIHVVKPSGILRHYEEVKPDGTTQIHKPEDIFHVVLNRNADEVHGTGDVQSIMVYLDKIKQLDEDMSVLFHKFVVPTMMFKLNTDNTTKIASYKTNMDKTLNQGQNIYVPQKAVEFDIIEAKERGQSTETWRRIWVDEIVRSGGVPALIMAQEAGTTEASSKMVVFTWQQVVRNEQTYFETQFKNQLGLNINLIPPPSIEDNLKNDEKKDGNILGEKESDLKAN